jgi:hypothetical protein
VIRYAMRAVNEQGRFTIATDVKDGKVRVVVTALDTNNEFLNFLNMQATGTDPELQTLEVPFRQEAPGRYVGEFPADKAGSYLLAIQTGQSGVPPLLTGVSVPYSPEFRMLSTNRSLLERLAALTPPGGERGQLVELPLSDATIPQVVATLDTFRRTLPPARSHRDRWPELLLAAAIMFWTDVLVRRVMIDLSGVRAAVARVLARWRQHQAAPAAEHLVRLRARKEQVARVLDERRQAARFDVGADAPAAPLDDITSAAEGRPPPAQPPADAPPPPVREEMSYTERLLAAKRKAQKP